MDYQGWLVGTTPRLVGDVTGDGIPDIVGFGYNSTYVAVGSRDSSGNLSFKLDPTTTIGDFGSVEGWSGSTLQAIQTRDYPLIQGCVLALALSYVGINLVTGLIYAAIDPRVRLQT